MTALSETPAAANEIFRSDDVVVRRIAAGDTSRWVVTFDHYAIGHGFDRPGFGEAYFQAQGVSAIHVMGRGDDWYQYADMEAALATVRAATAGATRVLTYGSSMGGYAALRFADAVGATDALALSPQYSIDPKVAVHERRWSQDFHRIRWRPELSGPISTSARAVVIYDPTSPDRWHGERIAQDIAIDAIRLPYTAHPVTTYLSDTNLLGPLIASLLAGDFDARALRREARRLRAANGIYLGELAAAQPRRRVATALSLARRALAVSPGGYHAQVSLARLLSQEGQHDEALAILAAVVQQSDRTLTYVIDHANAFMAAGRTAEARIIADEALARAPDVAHLHAWAAHICWLNGDLSDARSLIRGALRLDPSNQTYLRAAIDYHFGAPHMERSRGVQVTPWLRLVRWIMRSPLRVDSSETERRPSLFRRRHGESASDSAG
ncbi:tetratricopeptide repeat protein [Brevundimonas sp. NIBR11]|uniref:tetratricopeptide repeat protein n=1 Tax=Brevundimonas sp. NIBR11 TaxID=3015999 RepID=UPI0022EFF12E|nr:tetratricopeptide repeat protein [Brevundimonas sp. NIBR11]